MRAVPLGGQGLTVSRIGLGCMGMSDFYEDRGRWEDIDRHWKAWRDAFTALRRADPLLSSWQVRVLHHGGGRDSSAHQSQRRRG